MKFSFGYINTLLVRGGGLRLCRRGFNRRVIKEVAFPIERSPVCYDRSNSHPDAKAASEFRFCTRIEKAAEKL
jgi:hypothetical protein